MDALRRDQTFYQKASGGRGVKEPDATSSSQKDQDSITYLYNYKSELPFYYNSSHNFKLY